MEISNGIRKLSIIFNSYYFKFRNNEELNNLKMKNSQLEHEIHEIKSALRKAELIVEDSKNQFT